jgi:dihydroxyacetone kinase-like predicted kinase
MIIKEHTPQPEYDAFFTITGDNIDELIDYCMPLIRAESKNFYQKELREKLSLYGQSVIDVHAGNKVGYHVIFERIT